MRAHIEALHAGDQGYLAAELRHSLADPSPARLQQGLRIDRGEVRGKVQTEAVEVLETLHRGKNARSRAGQQRAAVRDEVPDRAACQRQRAERQPRRCSQSNAGVKLLGGREGESASHLISNQAKNRLNQVV